jgi:hypothetical protein
MCLCKRTFARGLFKVQDGRRNDHDYWHRRSRPLPAPVGGDRQLQYRTEGRGGISRRPCQQGCFPGHPREIAEAAAQIRRRPFREGAVRNIKKGLDAILVGNDTEASAVIHSAIEDFAQELAHVTGRFLKTKAWEKTERIA